MLILPKVSYDDIYYSALIHAVIVLFLVTIIVFFVMRLLPGDPLIIYVAQTAKLEPMPPEMLGELRREFGLDKPIAV